MKAMCRAILIICSLFLVDTTFDGFIHSGFIIREAEAVVGRPLTPVSYAGVARRTTRRVIRRTSVYANTLPAGCRTVVIEGTTLHQCGTTYYQPYNNRYAVVTVR